MIKKHTWTERLSLRHHRTVQSQIDCHRWNINRVSGSMERRGNISKGWHSLLGKILKEASSSVLLYPADSSPTVYHQITYNGHHPGLCSNYRIMDLHSFLSIASLISFILGIHSYCLSLMCCKYFFLILSISLDFVSFSLNISDHFVSNVLVTCMVNLRILRVTLLDYISLALIPNYIKYFYGIRCHRCRNILDKFSAHFSLVSDFT